MKLKPFLMNNLASRCLSILKFLSIKTIMILAVVRSAFFYELSDTQRIPKKRFHTFELN